MAKVDQHLLLVHNQYLLNLAAAMDRLLILVQHLNNKFLPTAEVVDMDTTKADRHLPLVHQQVDLAMMDLSSSNKEATVELAEGEAVTAKAEVRPTFARLPQSVQIGDEMKKKESGKGKEKRKEKVDAGQSSITNRTCHMQPDIVKETLGAAH